MDTETFARNTPPRRRKSRLQKFKNEIRELKQWGYTDLQIRDWLAQNDVMVSRENVRKFVKHHLALSGNASHDLMSANPIETLDANELPQEGTVAITNDNGETESQAEKLRRLARKQRDEADQTQFKHNKIGNNH